MSINDLQCRTAKPSAKPYKLHDSDGLYLKVMPNKAKYWRLRYRLFAKDKEMSLGVYPEVSLQEARKNRDEARQKVRDGLDPALIRLEPAAARHFCPSEHVRTDGSGMASKTNWPLER